MHPYDAIAEGLVALVLFAATTWLQGPGEGAGDPYARAQAILGGSGGELSEEDLERLWADLATLAAAPTTEPLQQAGELYAVLGDRLWRASDARGAARALGSAARTYEDLAAYLAQNQATVLKRLGEADRAARIEERLIDHWEARGNPAFAAELQLNLGNTRFRQGRLDEAVALTDAALARFRAAGQVEHALKALVSRGATRRRLGRYAEALADLEAAAAEAAAGGFPAEEARAHQNAGNVFQQLGRHGEARLRFERARDLWAPWGGPDLAKVEASLGLVLDSLGDDPEALAVFDDALEVFDAESHPYARAAVLFDRAGILIDLGRGDEAEQVFAELERMPLTAADPSLAGDLAFGRARLQEVRGDLEGALAQLAAAEALYRALDDPLAVAGVHESLSLIHI